MMTPRLNGSFSSNQGAAFRSSRLFSKTESRLWRRQAPRCRRRTTARQAQQHSRQAHGRGEGPRRLEDRRTIEADLGRCRYLATLIGAGNETVLRWFILVVALLLDPAAVLLLLAAIWTR